MMRQDMRYAKAGPLLAEMNGNDKLVKHFRQILLWPVYLLPRADGSVVEDHAAELARVGAASPWFAVRDEFTSDPLAFQERHYREFVTFLPAVQRFLYGQKAGRLSNGDGDFHRCPTRLMRRSDVRAARVLLAPDQRPVTLGVAHVDLYFFLGVDIAMLAVELHADDVPFAVAQELLLRLGRAYPASWSEEGRAEDCPLLVEWLSAAGETLTASDYDDRRKYLTSVCARRIPAVASHWDHLMRPLAPSGAEDGGMVRYRQLEYSQMPLMAWLAMEKPHALTRADHVRLAFASGPGDSAQLPFAEQALADFEKRFCYDRFDKTCDGRERRSARYMSSGQTFVVTGDATDSLFTDVERGYLGSFRHEHFLIFMIAHFHKAALLMFSDRLTEMVNKLGDTDPETVRAFRSGTRQALGAFLRFTHRYWFEQVSNQELAIDLFRLCRRHLNLDRLYDDIRQEVEEMSQYLETEVLRHQNNTVVRLTVVTTFGLIGTVTTGFLGMNILAWADLPIMERISYFIIVLIPCTVLTLYAVIRSRRLSEFLDVLSDENAGAAAKWRALGKVLWSRPPPRRGRG